MRVLCELLRPAMRTVMAAEPSLEVRGRPAASGCASVQKAHAAPARAERLELERAVSHAFVEVRVAVARDRKQVWRAVSRVIARGRKRAQRAAFERERALAEASRAVAEIQPGAVVVRDLNEVEQSIARI